MRAKILLALDGSEPSMKAAQYVANLLGNQPDVFVTLFHVLSSIPPSLLEHGGDEASPTEASEAEVEFERQRTSWIEAKQAVECQFFDSVRQMFKQVGFRDEQIQTKCSAPIPESDVAHEILQECQEGGYDTVVMGKRGQSRIRAFLTGSVTEKVVRHVKGCAVWVIE